ncbi:hypothetical protein BDY21DRAFT_370623 [Lineolata rhizophorae]|uniref:Uncharacterized protein n=1 Tax=Lineolata rhizophorae TaxID=578093 RepID=A0A6A6P565_9PEZI|nr:hypothetical protein BDY21DRAFT_370623 [Lineolata rhizophorae]
MEGRESDPGLSAGHPKAELDMAARFFAHELPADNLMFPDFETATASRGVICSPEVHHINQKERFVYVAKLLESMLNVVGVKDHDPKMSRRFNGVDAYPEYAIEAACWELFERVEKLHNQSGLPQPFLHCRGNKSIHDIVTEEDIALQLPVRMMQICILLREWKSACDNVINNYSMDLIVIAPEKIRKRKEGNKRGNCRKQERLKAGKAAEKAAKIARRRQERNG